MSLYEVFFNMLVVGSLPQLCWIWYNDRKRPRVMEGV
jgi:hypothetical protein